MGDAAVLNRTRLGGLAYDLNAGIGVGFWNKADAATHADYLTRRDDYAYAMIRQPTASGTHDIWFVRPAQLVKEVA